MNPLLKKEIRLLLPSWIVAVLLALSPAWASEHTGIPLVLLFIGLAMLALTTFGRETSLNTFSSLLAQPAERILIWRTKLSVLAGAFLTVCGLWLTSFVISRYAKDYSSNASYGYFIPVCLIITATFTGGLWTTLLLRQLAGAFWLTLLMPVVLFSVVFFAPSESSRTSITQSADFCLRAGCIFARRTWVGLAGSFRFPNGKSFRRGRSMLFQPEIGDRLSRC
jgi:hypothetical protein